MLSADILVMFGPAGADDVMIDDVTGAYMDWQSASEKLGFIGDIDCVTMAPIDVTGGRLEYMHADTGLSGTA